MDRIKMITNIKDFKLHLESLTKRDNKDDIFDHKAIINEEWRKHIKAAQEYQNINFDLENDDTDSKRTLFIKQNLRKDQPVKTEINLELCVAGGDWETPVYYFKIEFTHDHFIYTYTQNKKPDEFVWDKESGKKHVYIPTIEQGNNLYKTDKGYTAYTDETIVSDGFKLKDDKFKTGPKRAKAMWKMMEEFLIDLNSKRHRLLDDNKNTEVSDPEPQPLKKVESVVTIIKEDNNYNIHHNGDVPYIIRHRDNVKQVILNQRVETFEYKKMFEPVVGKGQDENNTILLQIEDDKYVYVGPQVYEFKTEDTIEEYYSFIGNSDVPYPVAVGKEFIYFMLDKQFVPRSEFPEDTDWLEDAYNMFYGHMNKDLDLTKMDFNVNILFKHEA